MKLPLFFITTFIFLSLTSFGQTLYVDSSATLGGNGGSWTSAFTELSDALDSAWHNPMIEEVRVAKGTYHPDRKPYEMDVARVGTVITNLYNKQLTFHIRTGLEVLGGFPSGGGLQNSVLNKSILDGILASGDSSYHVVYIDSNSYWAQANDTTVLNGFVIQNGNNSISPAYQLAPICNGEYYYLLHGGGGILVSHATVNISNNEIRNNVLTGLTIKNGTYAVIRSNQIHNNTSYNIDSSDNSNTAGFYSHSSNVLFEDNHVYNNKGNYSDGGIGIAFGKNAIVRGNRITKNTAGQIAGASIFGNNGLVENNIIDSNFSTGGVGGFSMSGATIMKNNYIAYNKGTVGGGEIYDSVVFVNNLIYSNTNIGIAINNSPNSIIVNNTIVRNGVKICCSSPKLLNNIIWGNNNSDFFVVNATSTPNYEIQFNLLQKDSIDYGLATNDPLGNMAVGNLFNKNPIFVDIMNPLGPDNIFGTADDGLHLQGNSPCIDAGSNNLLPAGITTDITGAPRIQNGIVNMGAYENLAWPLAINNKVDREVLDVFPNPTHEKINIETPMNGELFIMDVIGNKIATYQVEKGITQLDVSRFASGPYFITLNNNYKSWNAKFIKR